MQKNIQLEPEQKPVKKKQTLAILALVFSCIALGVLVPAAFLSDAVFNWIGGLPDGQLLVLLIFPLIIVFVILLIVVTVPTLYAIASLILIKFSYKYMHKQAQGAVLKTCLAYIFGLAAILLNIAMAVILIVRWVRL